MPTAILPGHAAGQPLQPEHRSRLEQVFAADLSAVRIHSDAPAHAAARDHRARAFTAGSHIYLGANQRVTDLELVAHEAAHTVQQSAAQNAAYAHGPPAPAALTLSNAPAQTVQCWPEFIDDAADAVGDFASDVGGAIYDAGSAAVGWAGDRIGDAVWWTAKRMLPGRLVSIIEDIRAAPSFWEYLKNLILSPVRRVFEGLANARDFIFDVIGEISGLGGRVVRIVAALAKGNCGPLLQGVRELKKVVTDLGGAIKDKLVAFFTPIGNFFQDVYNKILKPVGEFLTGVARDVWDTITWFAGKIWDLTEPVRNALSAAWDFIKGLIFGDEEQSSAGGSSNGFMDWILGKAQAVWEAIKAPFQPVIDALSSVWGAISNFAPIRRIGRFLDSIANWADHAADMADHLEDNRVAQNQKPLREQILPGILGAIDAVRGVVGAAGEWIVGAVTTVTNGIGSLLSGLGSVPGLNLVAGLFDWLGNAARELGSWVVSGIGGLFNGIDTGLRVLRSWVAPILRGLEKIFQVLSDLVSRFGELIKDVWHLIPACIREPLQDFLVNQILRRIPIFSQILEVPNIVSRALGLARRILIQVFVHGDLLGAAWTFFSSVLEFFGLPPKFVLSIVSNALRALRDIIRNPLGFLGNCFRAIGQGFRQFFGKIGTHLLNGVANWLFGGLGEAGIRVPREFSLAAVFDVVLQVIDLTRERIFQRIAARTSLQTAERLRRMLAAGERVFRWLTLLMERGPAGLWEELQSQLSGLWDRVLDAVISFITQRIIAKATQWLLGLLDVTGIMPIVNSVIAIYNAIESFFRYLRELLEIVNKVFISLGEIARGAIGAAADALENAAARAVPVVIGFLANQFGFGRIGDRIREVITGIRGLVDRALDWLIDRTIAGASWLVETGRQGIAAVADWLGLRRPFRSANGENHQLYFRGQSEAAQMVVESTPRPLVDYLADYEQTRNPTPAERAAIVQIRSRITEIETIKSAGGARGRGSFSQADGESIRVKFDAVVQLLQRLRGDGSTPPPSQIAERAVLSGSGDGWKMIAHPLSINPGGLAGGQPFGESSLWLSVSRRKRQAGKNTFYVRGHLLNHHVHGAGSIDNMIPITSTANGQMERLAETHVKNAVLNQNKVVRYEVEALFGGHPGRTRIPDEARLPTQIRMAAMELHKPADAWVVNSSAPPVLPQVLVPNTLPGDADGYIQPAG